MPKLIFGKDLDFFGNINKEVFKAFMSTVKIFNVKKAESFSVYPEDPNLMFEDPYDMECYIQNPKDWKNTLTKFGLDETRDLIIFFSLDLIAERGVKPPIEGTQIEFQNDRYLVIQTNSNNYLNNIFRQFTYQVELKRIRYESPNAGTSIIKNY